MKIKDVIEDKVRASLSPTFLAVMNESHLHNVPPDSETHFKLVCASNSFQDQSRVKRHQHVYGLLSQELSSGVHALALHLYTPEEWGTIDRAPDSPDCMGGSAS